MARKVLAIKNYKQKKIFTGLTKFKKFLDKYRMKRSFNKVNVVSNLRVYAAMQI
jgi:hypothetical protein